LPRIFDRFVRADPSRGEVNGTGLGLAIAKWIADAHDATLSVRSSESAGSVFTAEFQLIDPSRPEPDCHDLTAHENGRGGRAPARGTPRP